MKIYASRRNQYDLDNYLGKDIWVKAGIMYRDSKPASSVGGTIKIYYIRILSENNDILRYNRIENSKVDSNRFIANTEFLNDVYEAHIRNVGLFSDNEVYSTDELLELIGLQQ